MEEKTLFTSEKSKIFLSIIWGLGLSTLFSKSCAYNKCEIIEYRGPPKELEKKIWNYGDKKCYRLQPQVVDCQGPKAPS